LRAAIPLVKEGAKTLLELADLTLFAIKSRPLDLDDKTVGLLTDETRARLDRLRQKLDESMDWSVGTLEKTLKDFAVGEGVGLGKFGPALRGVLSGGASAPDLASTLTALGREESLARLNDALFSGH
jgi:glutamyl-tRNA synthetase